MNKEKEKENKINLTKKVKLGVLFTLALVGIILIINYLNPVNMFFRELERSDYVKATAVYENKIKGHANKEQKLNGLFKLELNHIITKYEDGSVDYNDTIKLLEEYLTFNSMENEINESIEFINEKQEGLINAIFIEDLENLNIEILLYDKLQKNYLDRENWYDGNPIITKAAQESLNELEKIWKMDLSIEKYETINPDHSKLIIIKDDFLEQLDTITWKIRACYYPKVNSDRKKDIELSKKYINEMNETVSDFYEIYELYIKR